MSFESMIEFQRVGIFSGGKHHSKSHFLKYAVNRNRKHGDKYLVNYYLGITVLVSSLVALTAELNLQHLNVKVTSSLELSGDAELNPGSYQVIRSVQGSFTQGNVALIGETAGRQCACNALFSICWSVVRDICNWKSLALDYILVEGDKLYKSLKCRDYLNVDQLPRQVKIFERTVNLDILEENLHDSISVYGDSFVTNGLTVSNVNTSSGCILFLCSYAVALRRYVNGRGNVIYFLFDSHFRNSRGITDRGPGFSVFLCCCIVLQVHLSQHSLIHWKIYSVTVI